MFNFLDDSFGYMFYAGVVFFVIVFLCMILVSVTQAWGRPQGYMHQYMVNQYPDLPHDRALGIVNQVKASTQRYNVPAPVVLAIMDQESNFRNVRSRVDVVPCSAGYMQLLRTTASRLLGRHATCQELILNWRRNIDLGVKYIREMWDVTGHLAGAIGRYNGTHNLDYVYDVLKKRNRILQLRRAW